MALNQKTYLTYEQQIAHLQNKNLIIDDIPSAIKILKETSYFGLICGYKDTFKNPETYNFLPDTHFSDIYSLYLFDACLRDIFLKYILIFEKHIKSSISYHFTRLYGNGMRYYEDYANYEYGRHKTDLDKLFRKMNAKMKSRHVSVQIAHYMNTYQDVPLWVLNTDLTLGEISTMFRYLKGSCKTSVCNEFNQIGRAELSKILIILTKFRNICAHGNRLFNYRCQDALLDSTIHKKLQIPIINNRYIQGKSDLFAAVISLKYVLSNDDFKAFFYDLKKSIQQYAPAENILALMGFPKNWTNILKTAP